MKKNMGSTDRAVRLSVAILLIIFYFLGVFSETFGVIALVVAGVFTLTSLVSFCPLYTLFGLTTRNKKMV
jgi:hypothetical protein